MARRRKVFSEADLATAMGIADDAQKVWHLLDDAMKTQVVAHLKAAVIGEDGWPRVFVNKETGRFYKPHNDQERLFVYEDGPRYALCKGGEGSGKSTAGIVKTLQRIQRGMSGILCSPNLPHLKRSAWPEFRRWCPWNRVVKKHQRYGKLDWEPHEPFTIVFENDATLHITGIENPGSLEGPNINFAHFDEARHHPDGKALKVLDGRIRIPGPKGEPPQMYLTTTPSKNWLFEFFGPTIAQCPDCGEVRIDRASGNSWVCPTCERQDGVVADDLYAAFKADSRVITLRTEENEPNLFDGFAKSRSQTLTEKEIKVLLNAEWEDLSEGQPFLPDMTWWDNCKEELPPLTQGEPMVLGVDAATGRTTTSSDCFAIVGVTRHPDRNRSADTIAVRYAKVWQARPGKKIDYRGTWDDPGPERELLRLCGYEMDDGIPVRQRQGGYNIIAVTYDPTELHDMSQRLYRDGVAWFHEFAQGKQRQEADRQLLEMIKDHRIAHDGNTNLRDHIRNADRKTDDAGHKMRIVKRTDSLKVDLAIALSMACHQAMRLNL